MSLRSNPSFLRLFGGRLITNVGDSLYYIAAMWLVYDLTGSTALTGVIGFLIGIPSTFQFLFGPIADRYELRWLATVTQVVQGVGVATIPLAAAAGSLSVWLIVVVAPLLSLLNQAVYPATSAALPLVTNSDEELVTANSLLAASGQATSAVFNAVGGVLIGVVGAVSLFTIDVVTFGIAALLFVGIQTDSPESDTTADDDNYLQEIRQGIDYIRGSTITKMYGTTMVANIGSGAVFAVLPAFADTLGGPETYGYLLSAVAVGTLVGAVGASYVDDYPYALTMVVGSTISCLAFGTAATVDNVPVVLSLALVGTIPIGINNVLVSSMVQSTVDQALLGRVMSIVQSLTSAMMPVGNLVGGFLGDIYGAGTVVFALAVSQAVIAVTFLASRDLRSLPAIGDAEPADLGLHQ
jgi:MFS family permease